MRERNPELRGVTRSRQRIFERRRHDADHFVAYIAERNLPTDDFRVAAEAPFPQAMTEHDDAMIAATIFFRQKRAAKHRHDAEQRKETCRDALPRHLLRLSSARQVF